MKKITQKIKAIIFDLDGTILDTEIVWQQTTMELLRLKGIKPKESDKSMLNSFSGIGLEKSVTILKEKFNLKENVPQLVKEKISLAGKLMAKNNLQFIRM